MLRASQVDLSVIFRYEGQVFFLEQGAMPCFRCPHRTVRPFLVSPVADRGRNENSEKIRDNRICRNLRPVDGRGRERKIPRDPLQRLEDSPASPVCNQLLSPASAHNRPVVPDKAVSRGIDQQILHISQPAPDRVSARVNRSLQPRHIVVIAEDLQMRFADAPRPQLFLKDLVAEETFLIGVLDICCRVGNIISRLEDKSDRISSAVCPRHALHRIEKILL